MVVVYRANTAGNQFGMDEPTNQNILKTRPDNHRFLCSISWKAYDHLEAHRLQLQRTERRWVSKREVIERCLLQLAVGDSEAKP